MDSRPDFAEVLEVASQAGHILLENGAEISRVEDIMERIATHYGVSSGSFFVLSNGIFTTGHAEKVRKSGGQASTYANVDFIPLRGAKLSKVAAVNRLSYDIAADRCTLEEARVRLDEIRKDPGKSPLALILGSAISTAGFCAVFGGGFRDCLAAFIVGLLLYAFMLFVSNKYLSKIVGGIANAFVTCALCIVTWRIGLGISLSNIIIGAVMPLVPGVAFVNGVRDLANSDYLAGLTRLTDALLSFLYIALGVAAAFMLDGWIAGGLIDLPGMTVSPETYGYGWQALAALMGTLGFAIQYNTDREFYLPTSVVGIAGWLVYITMFRYAGATPAIGSLVAALVVCLLSRFFAVPFRCPAQVFVVCGIFTLVPGGGLFWFTYYLTVGQMALSSAAGFTALKVALCIVLGIVFAMELPQRLFSRRKGTH